MLTLNDKTISAFADLIIKTESVDFYFVGQEIHTDGMSIVECTNSKGVRVGVVYNPNKAKSAVYDEQSSSWLELSF